MPQRIKKDQKTGGAHPPHYQRLMDSWVGENSPPAPRQASYPQTVTHHLHISGDSIRSNHRRKHTGEVLGKYLLRVPKERT